MTDRTGGALSGRLRRTLRQTLLLSPVRFAIAFLRYFYYRTLRRQLRLYRADGDNVSENTVRHNLKGLSDLAVTRSTKLIRPLSCIETLEPTSRILSVGPRTEGEILNLVAHGFELSGIRGLDLISYSPWIDLGDMHRMPYADDSWDAVVLGWCLAYSNAPELAAREVLRVTRSGAIVCVGVEYNPAAEEEIVARLGYRPGAAARLASVESTLRLFGDHVDHVYFSHDVVPARRDRIGSVVAIFSTRK